MIVERQHAVVPNQPVVELHNVSRRFAIKLERHRSLQDLFVRFFQRNTPPVDEFWPLRNVSLAINAGDSIGVIGPNGTGKSTLLKLITGILEPTSGELHVRGRISSLLELGAGFHADLTGRENIFLNGSIYGLTRKQMNARVDDIIEYAELGDFIDTPVKHYSSGMYVRLGFAVAIYTNPDLLLIDEVLAVGDVAFQRKCLQSILEFQSQGLTLVLVSHDLGAIQKICKQAIWISDGEIKAQGAPTDVVMEYLHFMAQQEEAKQGGTQLAPTGQGQRWGTGQLQIERVDLCGEEGTPKSVFFTGDEMQIHLHYYSRQRIENPIFGLAIHHQSGINVFGPNTRFGGLDIPYVEGRGSVVYTLTRLPLLEGGFAVSVAAINDTDTETFDFHDRAYPFQVYPGSRNNGYGMVSLDGRWQLEQPKQIVTDGVPQTVA